MAIPQKRAVKRPGERQGSTLEEQVRGKLQERQQARKKEASAALRFLEKKLPLIVREWRKKQARGLYVEPSQIRTGNILLFGRPFLYTLSFAIVGRKGNKFVIKMGGLGHESPIVIGVCPLKEAIEGEGWHSNIAELNLGFEKNAVIIESMQGKGEQADLERFRQAVGKHAINSMVEFVERHAKECGFKQAKISRSENLFYYWFPEILEGFSGEEMRKYYSAWQTGKLMDFEGKLGQKVREIREGMQRLYGAVAKNSGYRPEGNYFVKDL